MKSTKAKVHIKLKSCKTTLNYLNTILYLSPYLSNILLPVVNRNKNEPTKILVAVGKKGMVSFLAFNGNRNFALYITDFESTREHVFTKAEISSPIKDSFERTKETVIN